MASVFTISPQLTYAKMQGYMPSFTAAARQTGVDRNLLLAVASRESAMGLSLGPLGLGDGGNGIGGMFAIIGKYLTAWFSAESSDAIGFRQSLLQRIDQLETKIYRMEEEQERWVLRYWSLYRWTLKYCMDHQLENLPPTFHEMEIDELQKSIINELSSQSDPIK